MVKRIIAATVAWKTLLLIFAYVATFIVPQYSEFIPKSEFRNNLPSLIWIWGNFDGFHYLYIAKHGYGQFQNPYFPLFPFFIYVFTSITHLPYIISGQLISTIAFILSLIIITKILIIDNQKKFTALLLLALFLFPTSFTYAAVYNDSLFLLFACLTIYYGRKKSFAIACIFAAFATFTRLNGLALAFYIIFEYLCSNEKNPLKTWNVTNLKKSLKSKITLNNIIQYKLYFITLIPLAFVGYLAYTHVVHGDWELVFSSMKVWQQERIIFPLQVFWRYFKIVVLYPTFKLNYYVAILELIFVLFYISVIVYTFKKIRISYWLFMVASLLIPSLTGTFAGMPRYALHLYPIFLGIAIFLTSKGILIKILYFVISTILLFIYITLFTRGYFVT